MQTKEWNHRKAKILRIRKNISTKTIAEEAGVSEDYIVKCFNGKMVPSNPLLRCIAFSLDVSIEDLGGKL